MLSLYFMPVLAVSTGLLTHSWQLFVAFILSGFGMAGIGMGVMHDAIHGTYSPNPKINKLLGYTLNMVGANATVWKIQHNVLHHSFTNIHEGDDDINSPFFLRFSPHVKKNALHSFQHWYTWFFYALSTLSWITTKDFIRLHRYHALGLLKGKNVYLKTFLKILVWKVVYFAFTLGLPILLSPFPTGEILIAFLSLHFVTGLCISLVFQTAHIMPDTNFYQIDSEGMVEGERLIHQLETTSNYSPKGRVFSWFIGGLNFQIEHHLFPDICHVHYRNLAKIVETTAVEYQLPYHSKTTFLEALKAHFQMLKHLGNLDDLPVSTPIIPQ